MIPTVAEHSDELKPICLRYSVQRLDLFGSAATGGYHPEESDLDFGANQGTLLNYWNKLDWRFCNPSEMKVLEWFGVVWLVGNPCPISIRPLPTFGVSKVFPAIQQRRLFFLGILFPATL